MQQRGRAAEERWWSRRLSCPKGHALYLRWLGPSREQSFRASFWKALARATGIFLLIFLTLAMAPDFPNARMRVAAVAADGLLVAVFYLVAGVLLLRKARVWAGRGGAVERLVPYARGRAHGFVVAVLGQLCLVIVVVIAFLSGS